MSCIEEVTPTTSTEIEACYQEPDYRDAFLVDSAIDSFPTVEDFATAYFVNQPAWLSLVSMNLMGRKRLQAALEATSFEVGEQIGSWKVHRRSEHEIVFGDDMGFMEYRFSMLRLPTGQIEASTAVQYRWKRLSHVYFSLVKPVHRKFVPLSLQAAKVGRPVGGPVAA